MFDKLSESANKTAGYVAILEIINLLKSTSSISGNVATSLLKLQEAEMWLRRDLEEIGIYEQVIKAYKEPKQDRDCGASSFSCNCPSCARKQKAQMEAVAGA